MKESQVAALLRHQAKHLAYLQARLDLLQASIDALAHASLMALAKVDAGDDADEAVIRLTMEEFYKAYAEARRRSSAKFSEFPYPDPPQSDEPS